jgi:ABC-type branched-subunit amino acid transport system substrate-binding protein
MKFYATWLTASVLVGGAALSTSPAVAQNTPGVSKSEIKIGNIMPYSGPASAYGVIGKTEAAYFNKINEAGGVNGRKINFISYDDGYSPPKTVEQARKLVESDEVLLIFNSLGTPTVIAHPDGCTAGLWASGVAASGKPFSVERIASSAAMPCRRAVSITERMSA